MFRITFALFTMQRNLSEQLSPEHKSLETVYLSGSLHRNKSQASKKDDRLTISFEGTPTDDEALVVVFEWGNRGRDVPERAWSG